MQFDVVTLFPEMFAAITQSGVTRRAFDQNKCGLSLWNPRDFTTDNHRTVDDRPYGGGPGMVMLAKPLEATLNAAKQRQTDAGLPAPRVLFMSPQGKQLTHERVMQLKQEAGLVILCGRYEAVDSVCWTAWSMKKSARRFRAVRRRAAGDGLDGCGDPPDSRRVEHRCLGHRRQLRQRPARFAALHAAGNV